MTGKPTSQRASKKREDILKEAVRQFNTNGYHDTRLEDISGALGKTKTSVSYHFKSKEALLEEALSASCDQVEIEFDIARDFNNGLDCVLNLVRRRAQNYANFLAGTAPPPAILLDQNRFTHTVPKALKIRFESQLSLLVDFLRLGQKDGSIAVTSPEASAFFIFNALNCIPGWLTDLPNAKHNSAIDGLCDLIRNGLYLDQKRAPAQSVFRIQQETYPEIFDRAVKNRLKRDAFLRAGTRHLNRAGYRNLSLNDIAADLGVTRGAFYYYIADKEALIEACFERSCDQIEKAFEMSKASPGRDKLEDIEQALSYLFEGHTTGLNPLVKHTLLNALKPEKRAVFEAKIKRLSAYFCEDVASATAEGTARTVDLTAVEHLLMGAIFAADQWRFSAPKAQHSGAAAAAAYFEPIFKGIAKT